MIPTGWVQSTLGEASGGIDYGYTTSASSEPRSHRFLRITDVVNGPIDWSSVPYCEVGENDAGKYGLVEGDVVIARTGATVGVAGFVQSPPAAVFASYLVRLRRSRVNDSRFLYYCLRSPKWMNFIDGFASGKSAQPNVSASSMAEYVVELPPVLEQRAISDVLGALDDKIESNRRQQSTLLGICHAAFDVALLSGAVAMKVEDMVRFRNNERKPLSAMDRAGMERRYPYYGATGVFDYVDAYLFDDVNILIGEDGSVVNDDGTPVAQMAWGKYWVNNHAHVLSGKAVSTELAYIALARSDVRPLITGAVQLKINMGNLKSLEVALPSVDVRGDVNREIQENLALWRAKSDESKMLVGLRDALLPELLSGRLRVKDAESMMENV
jgi:type I restriction enzyme S subunit